MSAIQGRVWKYGDDVNTDLLLPGRYTYTLREPDEIAAHALEDLDPDFANQVSEGDIVVGGSNFGCGSSREQAASCLVYNGVRAVIARSFGRIFYRNAINNGLPVLICGDAVDGLQHGEVAAVDLEALLVRGPRDSWAFAPLAGTVQAILDAGGLIPYVEARFADD